VMNAELHMICCRWFCSCTCSSRCRCATPTHPAELQLRDIKRAANSHTSVLCVQYNLAFDLQADSKDPQFWLDLSVDVLLGADMVLNVSRIISGFFSSWRSTDTFSMIAVAVSVHSPPAHARHHQ